MPNDRIPPFDPIVEAQRQWARRWDAVAPMAAVTSVMRVQQLLLGRINALLDPFELTFARYEALVLLAFSSRGSLPLGIMGERLMVHPTSMTSTVDRLEDQGLVRRQPDAEDRRRTLAVITDRGREVVAEATAVLVDARFGLEGFSDDDARALTESLTRLRAAVGDPVLDPAPRS